MRKLLQERDYPVEELRYFASARSAGTTLPWKDREITVEDAASADFEGLDVALFSAGGATSRAIAERVAAQGPVVVVGLSLGACVTSRVEDVRQTDTGLSEGEGVVIMAKSYHLGNETDPERRQPATEGDGLHAVPGHHDQQQHRRRGHQDEPDHADRPLHVRS